LTVADGEVQWVDISVVDRLAIGDILFAETGPFRPGGGGRAVDWTSLFDVNEVLVWSGDNFFPVFVLFVEFVFN